jgi:hypothetical protein
VGGPLSFCNRILRCKDATLLQRASGRKCCWRPRCSLASLRCKLEPELVRPTRAERHQNLSTRGAANVRQLCERYAIWFAHTCGLGDLKKLKLPAPSLLSQPAAHATCTPTILKIFPMAGGWKGITFPAVCSEARSMHKHPEQCTRRPRYPRCRQAKSMHTVTIKAQCAPLSRCTRCKQRLSLLLQYMRDHCCAANVQLRTEAIAISAKNSKANICDTVANAIELCKLALVVSKLYTFSQCIAEAVRQCAIR